MSNLYRKKPIVIEAVQWFSNGHAPNWAGRKISENGDHFTIETLEGVMRGNPGDWIIKGVKGEIYPCKPDVFEATYESAKPKAAQPKTFREKAEEHIGWTRYNFGEQSAEKVRAIYESSPKWGAEEQPAQPSAEVVKNALEDIQMIRAVAGDLDEGLIFKTDRRRGNIGGIVTRACERLEKAIAALQAVKGE